MDAPSSRSSDAAYAAPEVMDSTASRHRSREANALEAEASALAAAIASFAARAASVARPARFSGARSARCARRASQQNPSSSALRSGGDAGNAEDPAAEASSAAASLFTPACSLFPGFRVEGGVKIGGSVGFSHAHGENAVGASPATPPSSGNAPSSLRSVARAASPAARHALFASMNAASPRTPPRAILAARSACARRALCTLSVTPASFRASSAPPASAYSREVPRHACLSASNERMFAFRS